MSALTRRRALFSGAAAGSALALPAAAIAAYHPDAELIALCAQFELAEAQIRALYAGPGEIDEDEAMEVMATIQRRQIDPILDRMEVLRAETAAGIHARARAVTASNPNFESSFEYEGTYPERLLRYLMRDAMNLGEVRS